MTAYRRFLILWAGQLLSRTGSGISAFVLGVYVLGNTGSTTSYSTLLLAAFLPAVLLAPVGGLITDRFDRRKAMAIGDVGAALGIVIVMGTLWRWPASPMAVIGGLIISSAFTALHSPAFKASITDLLSEDDYARASGLVQLAEASRYVVSPVIAGLLIGRIEIHQVLVIDVLTFLAAAASVGFLRALPRSTQPRAVTVGWTQSLAAGVAYLVSSRSVSSLLAVTSLVTFVTGILQVLFVPVVLSFSDPATLGTVQSIAATGMVLGSVVVGLAGRTAGQARILARALLVAGGFLTLIGASRSPLQVTVVAFGFFVTLPFVNTSLEVLFRQRIEAAIQGRVWSLISVVSQSAMLIGIGVAGFAAEHWFDPLLTQGRLLHPMLGQWLGTGAAAGSGLLLMLAGVSLVVPALRVPAAVRHRLLP